MRPPVCPLDFRYGSEEMLSLFSEESRLKFMLKVESALAKSEAKYGLIPASAARAIEKAVSSDLVRTDRVKEIESEIGHDVMAMVRALSEVSGEGGSFVHFGATSNDIIDTATALQLREASHIMERALLELEETLASLALREMDTIMLGRTHGQAALPITFGLKIAVFLSELDRHLDRLKDAEKRVAVGKISGAVGTGASLGKNFFELQKDLMKTLGIELETASGQVVGRDRYAEFISVLSNLSSTLERMATEVRNLQRTEIDEVEEAFDEERQVGSSTMAQKRNPVLAENICGLARMVRAMLPPTFENMVMWHERDLTNSSAERITIPHACILTDDILRKSNRLFSGLIVKRENMARNLEKTSGLIMSERVMLRLAEKIGRQNAHEAVRRAAMKSYNGTDFLEALLSVPEISENMRRKELESLLDPRDYLGESVRIVKMVVAEIKNRRHIKNIKGP